MPYQERCEHYAEVERLRGRPLITYVTSSRQNAGGAMAPDVIPEFAAQISAVSPEANEVDLLVVSNGGDPTVSWRIVSMLRERFRYVGVLLPYAAYSAATLLALGANEILMHPFANLGPVDPQLTYVKPGSQPDQKVQFGSEDLRHYLEFVRSDVGITDQQQLEKAFELLCGDVGSIPIGVAKRSSFLALSLGERLLRLHMDDENQARAIAEALNRSFYHHGYPVGRSEAIRIELPVVEPEPQLETRMWSIWQDIETELEMNHAFNAMELVFANPAAAQALATAPLAQIPLNLPPAALQQVVQQIAQAINVVYVPPVEYSLFHATLESLRLRSEFHTRGQILSSRAADLSLKANLVALFQGWERL